MALRKYTNPRDLDLSPGLQDVLRRNGMQAHLSMLPNGQMQMIVLGHDSPAISYSLNDRQVEDLMGWGSNYANKKAYNTFTFIVKDDFHMPDNFVSARNAFGRVAMGLHGYRVGVGEYGRPMPLRPHAFGPAFLGWTPRQQQGYHLRRVADVPMVIEHPDGRLRPGELKSGGYGYYYKGSAPQAQQVADPLKELQTYFPPVQTRPRPAEPAKPYKELITSDVYFTNEKWQEVLSSHGIIIDADKKLLTIQSSGTRQDFVYDLTEEEVKKLTENSLKKVSLQERLDLLNHVIGGDFKDAITKDMLNSTERINITLKPEVEQTLTLQAQQRGIQTVDVIPDPLQEQQHLASTLNPEEGYVNGAELAEGNERKGWYREGNHGREVEVGDIWVEKVQPEQPQQQETQKNKGDKSNEKVTYRMSAVINGQVVSHEISKKQYDKFFAVDDYQRQRMLSKVFNEVDLKTRPELRQGFHLGAFLAAAGEATYLGADIAHNVDHIRHPHYAPDVYHEVHGTGRIYVKPGVDSPQDIASRAFEAGLNQGMYGHGIGR